MTDPDGPDAISPRALVRPAHCVPETKNAYDLLEEFRTRRTQIAIVLDEYGSVAGLITLEDLLEELVGTIDDEHDVPSKPDPLVSLGGTRYEVDATVDLEQLNERLTLRLPTDGDFLTIGGLAFHALGRVPEPGVTFQFSGVEFTVVEVVDHAIRRVRLDLQPREAVGEPVATRLVFPGRLDRREWSHRTVAVRLLREESSPPWPPRPSNHRNRPLPRRRRSRRWRTAIA